MGGGPLFTRSRGPVPSIQGMFPRRTPSDPFQTPYLFSSHLPYLWVTRCQGEDRVQVRGISQCQSGDGLELRRGWMWTYESTLGSGWEWGTGTRHECQRSTDLPGPIEDRPVVVSSLFLEIPTSDLFSVGHPCRRGRPDPDTPSVVPRGFGEDGRS